MKTVGILGGGQLARMMILAGAPLGLRFRIYDPSPEACAGQLAPLVTGQFDDLAALQAFAGSVDVITFDFENVPAASVAALSALRPVFPNPRDFLVLGLAAGLALALLQTTYFELRRQRELAPYRVIASLGAMQLGTVPSLPGGTELLALDHLHSVAALPEKTGERES